jgi:hypothetical protein
MQCLGQWWFCEAGCCLEEKERMNMKVKVKFTLDQAMKVQRWSKVIALLFL